VVQQTRHLTETGCAHCAYLPLDPYSETKSTYIISQCPASRAVLHDPKFFNRFQGLTRLIGTQPFQLLDSEEQIRVALGNPPLSLMRKDFHTWRQEATVMCGEFALVLRMHLRPLQPITPSFSSDDNSSRESDDEEPSGLTLPPQFKISSATPPKTVSSPSTLKKYNWWDNIFHTSGTVMGVVRE